MSSPSPKRSTLLLGAPPGSEHATTPRSEPGANARDSAGSAPIDAAAPALPRRGGATPAGLSPLDDREDRPPDIDGIVDPVYLSGGGCATVWVGRSTTLGELVAVKVPRARLLSAALLDRFAEEGHLLSRLRHHPNVVRVLGMTRAVLADGSVVPAIVMELVPQARSLLGYCEERHLDQHDRLRLFRAACAGVAHLHRAGVVHLDLKPSNILVDAHGVPRVADLGAARTLLDNDQHRTFFTPQYASPEQLRDAGDGAPRAAPADDAPRPLDQTSDVYSLGKILAALLGGAKVVALPTGLRTIEERSRHALAWSPATLLKALGDPDEALCEIVLRATEPQPQRRYHDARDLVAAIDDLLRPWPLRVARHATATMASMPRAARRFGSRCAGVALSAVLAVAASSVIVLALHRLSIMAISDGPSGAMSAVVDRVPPPKSFSEVCVIEIRPDTDLASLARAAEDAPLDPARPWTFRRVHASLIDRLAESGARAIALDVEFPSTPAAAEATAELVRAIDRARSVHGCPVVVGTKALVPDPTAEFLEPALRAVVAGWGSIEGFEIDGVGRTMPMLAETPEGTTAMGLAMAAVRASRRVEAITLESSQVFLRGGWPEQRRLGPAAVRDLAGFSEVLSQTPVLAGARTAVHSSNLPPRELLESITIDAQHVLQPGRAGALAEQVRGRIALVSNNYGHRDEHPTRTIGGRPVFMPWWHATAIETMVHPTMAAPRDGLVMMVMAACAGAGFAVAAPLSMGIRRWARQRGLSPRERVTLLAAAGGTTLLLLVAIGLVLAAARPGVSMEAFSAALSLLFGIVVAVTSVALATRSWRREPHRQLVAPRSAPQKSRHGHLPVAPTSCSP